MLQVVAPRPSVPLTGGSVPPTKQSERNAVNDCVQKFHQRARMLRPAFPEGLGVWHGRNNTQNKMSNENDQHHSAIH